jgi:hypothetical protein
MSFPARNERWIAHGICFLLLELFEMYHYIDRGMPITVINFHTQWAGCISWCGEYNVGTTSEW